MGNIKQINIKNRTYYFLNAMINVKNFDSSLVKIDKKPYKNIGIYNIRYIAIKKLMIMKIYGKVDVYMEKTNGNIYIYIVFTSTNDHKKVVAKFSKVWGEIK